MDTYSTEETAIYHSILDCTIQLFNEKGLQFKMSEVADQLHISKKTIYKYFKNKEALIYSVIEGMFKEIKDLEHAIYLSEDLTPSEKLLEMLCVYPLKYRINYSYLNEMRTHYPSVFKIIEDQLSRNWDETFDLLDQSISAKEIKPIDRLVFKTLFLGLYKELLYQYSASPDHLLRDCIETIFNGLR